MKLKLMVMAALAACVAAAMPTKEEIAKANNEVRELLKARIADWKSGRISDKSFAQFMYGQALQYKYKDEARFYACLQSAFAVAVRADNAKLAAKVIETLASDIKGFDDATEEALFEKAFAKIDGEKAKAFRYRLETERARLSCATHVSDGTAATIAKMNMVIIPSLDIKENTTLADAVGILRDLGRKYDSVATDEKDKGFDLVVSGVTYDKLLKARRLPASGAGDGFETCEFTLPSSGLGRGDNNPSSRNLMTIFSEFGILWPKGSSLVFEKTSGKLIVTNTSENLGMIEEIMSSAAQTGVPMPTLPAIRTGAISFYDAVKTVTEEADMEFKVDGPVVGICPDKAKLALAVFKKNKTRNSMSDIKRKVEGAHSRSRAMDDLSFGGNYLRAAIEMASRERKAYHLPSAWPRTVAGKGTDKDDIAERGFKSAADYFTALFDLKNMGTADWAPYVEANHSLLGQNAVVKNAIVADALDWCIAANVPDDLPDNVPVLISANFNPALLLRKWDGITDADKILPIGPASGAARSMFDDEGIAVVYKNGMRKEIIAKYLTYSNLYQRHKPFDTTKSDPPLVYLTPTGIAEPTAGKNR